MLGAMEVKSGAIEPDARQAFMERYADFNLHLAFTEDRGSFLAGVDVTIHDMEGTVLWSGNADAAMLFASLPAGQYVVEARFGGCTKRQAVAVDRGPGEWIRLSWPRTSPDS
jgi:hypothetical protein